MKNRDGKIGNKRAERQTELSGKRPFHRMAKIEKRLRKLNAGFIENGNR